jgi:O-antigen ligase
VAERGRAILPRRLTSSRVRAPLHPNGGSLSFPPRPIGISPTLAMTMWVELRRGETLDTASGRAHSAVGSKMAEKHGQKVEQVLFWAFIAGLAWTPFWFGSNDLIAWGINAVLFPGLAVAYEAWILIRGERHPLAIQKLRIPAALFIAVVLWIAFQNATWSPSFLHHPIWEMTADTLDRPVAGSISVNRDLTTLALLRLVTAASVFWIAVQLCRDASRAIHLLFSIAIIGAIYACYGLISLAMTPGYVLWVLTSRQPGFVSSTFISRNCFAAYAGMVLVAIAGLILRLYRREFTSVGGSVRYRIATFIAVTGQKGAALLACGFVVLVALLLSGSRGGIVATALGLCILGTLTLRRRKKGSAEQREAIIVIGAVLLVATFMGFGDVLIGKFTREGLYDLGRVQVFTITIGSILHAPMLGYGYGTFEDVFPMFRDQSMNPCCTWDKAHNTYLEVFQGLGLIFGSMLVASVVLLVIRCVKGAITRRQNEIIPCVAASVAFLLGAHSLVDFSLQMQAVAITFMAVLGAGVAQSESSRLMHKEKATEVETVAGKLSPSKQLLQQSAHAQSILINSPV